MSPLNNITIATRTAGYHEKAAWACLVSIVLVFVPYFFIVFANPMAFVGLFALAVAALVALLVGFHFINALMTPSIRSKGDTPEPDEMDRAIEIRAAKLAGLVLGVIVLAWSIGMMFGVPILAVTEIARAEAATGTASASNFAIPATRAVFWIQILFAGFVAANLTYYGKIITSYRRMANG